MLTAMLTFPLPLGIAVLMGLHGGRSDPQTMAEFGKTAAFILAWSILFIFTWHALWITSMVPARWTDTIQSAAIWTLWTGAIWLPILMITYVLRAMKARRDG